MDSFGFVMYYGCARHRDARLDAAGALADLPTFIHFLAGLDILHDMQGQKQQGTPTQHVAAAGCGLACAAMKSSKCMQCLHSDLAGGAARDALGDNRGSKPPLAGPFRGLRGSKAWQKYYTRCCNTWKEVLYSKQEY